MLKALIYLLALAIVGGVALLIAGRLGAFTGRPPATLGVKDGRLAPPSTTPNSVSSQASLHAGHPMRERAQIEPLALRGNAAATMQRLRTVIESMPGATLVEARPDYLRAEFRTRWMGFVDDAEFWADPAAGVIQVRSASRVGRKDFDVNRARVESIRRKLAAG